MSRWRETLCGSVIKTANEPGNISNLVPGNSSEVLSCGGAFLPHSKMTALKNNQISKLVHLPKEKGEVVVCGPDADYAHFSAGDSADDFLEALDGTINQLESKLSRNK